MKRFARWAAVPAAVSGVTLLCRAAGANEITAGFLLLLAVLGLATWGGWAVGAAASVAATFCLNFFFLPPTGTLTIEGLGELAYYGRFRADDETVGYVLRMEQSRVIGVSGQPMAANRAVFTWQDGRGERGRGWLLINREDTTLTGEHGHGERSRGGGGWTFIRAL